MLVRGSWVEVQRTLLEAGSRAPQLPADTAALPYVARICGFLLNDADLGSEAEIETVAGRQVRGTVIAVNPRFEHDFGLPVVELLRVGSELRSLLAHGPDQ